MLVCYQLDYADLTTVMESDRSSKRGSWLPYTLRSKGY